MMKLGTAKICFKGAAPLTGRITFQGKTYANRKKASKELHLLRAESLILSGGDFVGMLASKELHLLRAESHGILSADDFLVPASKELHLLRAESRGRFP